MTTDLIYPLKREFREPLRSAGFIGRASELSSLRSLINSNSSATVLLSGHRGVGKTALVNEAIRLAKSDAKETPIDIRLSLPHLYSAQASRDDDLRGQVLRSLARGTYFALKVSKAPKELKERAEELYNKTYLKEISDSRGITAIAEANLEQRKATTRQVSITPSKVFQTVLGSALYAAIAVGGVAVASRIGADHGAIYGWLSMAFIVVVGVASAFTITRTHSDSETKTQGLSARTNQSKTGVYDLSPETLEYELLDLLRMLAEEKCPCLFVIDELDKLETFETGEEGKLEQHVIFRIVACLKNFFTLGSGIYFFISGEDFYTALQVSIESGEYSQAHTLFTERIFIHTLHYREVERLVDGLLERPDLSDLQYRMFRNYLCWVSRNHVFDLLSWITGFLEFDAGSKPIISAHTGSDIDGEWREGNLPNNWQIAAGIEKFVGAVYDESRRRSTRDERFNQDLWMTLSRVATLLLNKESIDITEDEYELPASWLPTLSLTDRVDLSGAVERLLKRMERNSVLGTRAAQVLVPAEPSAPDEGETTRSGVRYSLLDNPSYPSEKMARESILTAFESGMISTTERLDVIVGNARAAGIDLSAFEEDIAEADGIAAAVRNTAARFSQPKSRTVRALELADDVSLRVFDHAIESSVFNWIASVGLTHSDVLAEPEPRTAQPWSETLRGEFPGVVGLLEANSEIPFVLVGSMEGENQMLILMRASDKQVSELSENYKGSLTGDKGRERRRQRLPVIQVTVAPPDALPEMPREVIEVFTQNKKKGFFSLISSIFGGGGGPEVKTSKREEVVMGWHVLAITPELDNLAEVPERLSEASFVTVA